LIVIGGGVIGCSIAWRLAQSGRRVVLLERGECGRESSWAGAGIIEAGSLRRIDPLALLRRRSVAMYESFAAELRESSGIDPEYMRCGGLDLVLDENQYAAAQRELVAAREHAAQHGGAAALEWIEASDLPKREPSLSPASRGALRSPHAAQARNPRLMRALRVACERAHVIIREHEPALGLLHDGERVVGVRTHAARYHAAQTVLAAGAWSAQFDARVSDAIRCFPVRGQIVLLDPGEPRLQHVVQSGNSYLVPRRDGRVLVGSTEEPEAGFDCSTTASGVARLLQFVERVAPGLRDAPVAATWAGLRPGTADGKPYIGRVPGFDGLIAATGHSRAGLTLAPVTAEVIVQLIENAPTAVDLQAFAPGRPLQPDSEAG
jgi:glycine oxidase